MVNDQIKWAAGGEICPAAEGAKTRRRNSAETGSGSSWKGAVGTPAGCGVEVAGSSCRLRCDARSEGIQGITADVRRLHEQRAGIEPVWRNSSAETNVGRRTPEVKARCVKMKPRLVVDDVDLFGDAVQCRTRPTLQFIWRARCSSDNRRSTTAGVQIYGPSADDYRSGNRQMAQRSHYVNSPSPTSRLPDAEKTEGRPSSACRRRVSYLRGRLAPSASLPLLSASLYPSVTRPESNDSSYLDHITFPLQVPS